MSGKWTPEQKRYVAEAMGEIKRIADLAEMARLRRRAEAESANIVIGSEL